MVMDVGVEITAQFARYESLWDQVRKRRNLSSEKVEAMLVSKASFLEEEVQNTTPRGWYRKRESAL